jgi:hypothetical protein
MASANKSFADGCRRAALMPFSFVFISARWLLLPALEAVNSFRATIAHLGIRVEGFLLLFSHFVWQCLRGKAAFAPEPYAHRFQAQWVKTWRKLAQRAKGRNPQEPL